MNDRIELTPGVNTVRSGGALRRDFTNRAGTLRLLFAIPLFACIQSECSNRADSPRQYRPGVAVLFVISTIPRLLHCFALDVVDQTATLGDRMFSDLADCVWNAQSAK